MNTLYLQAYICIICTTWYTYDGNEDSVSDILGNTIWKRIGGQQVVVILFPIEQQQYKHKKQ